MNLNESQVRHLAAALSTVEKWLTEAEAIASNPYQGIVVGTEPVLSAKQQAAFMEGAAAMRAEISRAAEQFTVDRSDRPASQAINALLGLMWETLEGTHPTRFTGYGPLEADAARALASHVEALIAAVDCMRGALAE